jgi:hypothetical protein
MLRKKLQVTKWSNEATVTLPTVAVANTIHAIPFLPVELLLPIKVIFPSAVATISLTVTAGLLVRKTFHL